MISPWFIIKYQTNRDQLISFEAKYCDGEADIGSCNVLV